MLGLGNYDADKSEFVATLDLASPAVELPRSPLLLTTRRDPSDPYFRSVGTWDDSLPMSPAEAEALEGRLPRYGARQLYAVSKIRFEAVDVYGLPEQRVDLWFRTESPQVRVYLDEALREQVATLTLPDLTDGTENPFIGPRKVAPPATWAELSKVLESHTWSREYGDYLQNMTNSEMRLAFTNMRGYCEPVSEASSLRNECMSWCDPDFALRNAEPNEKSRTAARRLQSCLIFRQSLEESLARELR